MCEFLLALHVQVTLRYQTNGSSPLRSASLVGQAEMRFGLNLIAFASEIAILQVGRIRL
jgi:hypothetical protein